MNLLRKFHFHNPFQSRLQKNTIDYPVLVKTFDRQILWRSLENVFSDSAELLQGNAKIGVYI